MTAFKRSVSALLLWAAFGPLTAWGGPIFLTGHDPDFHAQSSGGAQNLLDAGLSFVTGATHDLSDGNKFLWVESRIPTPSGHRIGENGLGSIGLSLGTHYDRANAAELPAVTFSDYTAIAVASAFGGLLTRAELDGLIAREAEIADFVNAGGGLLALAECYPCGANLLGGATPPDLFGFVPVSVTSIGANPPFTVTAAGGGSPFFLTNSDVNDPTHNSFGEVGRLTVLDTDVPGNAVTLAGNVTITDDTFIPTVPEPGVLALLLIGAMGGAGALGRRKR